MHYSLRRGSDIVTHADRKWSTYSGDCKELRSVHMTYPTLPHLTSSQLMTFYLNWVRCDWSQPWQTASCAVCAPNECWCWCADMQVKTKFWGKSMEVQPLGIVNLQLVKWDWCFGWLIIENWVFESIVLCWHTHVGWYRRSLDEYRH